MCLCVYVSVRDSEGSPMSHSHCIHCKQHVSPQIQTWKHPNECVDEYLHIAQKKGTIKFRLGHPSKCVDEYLNIATHKKKT